MAYPERLHAAKVPCETIGVDGVFHGFDGIVEDSAATQRLGSRCLPQCGRRWPPQRERSQSLAGTVSARADSVAVNAVVGLQVRLPRDPQNPTAPPGSEGAPYY